MHCKRMRFFVACLLTSVTAIAAEEPQQVYVLCEESSGSSETHSAAYIFDFKQNVFYPIAHADDLTRFSETPTEINGRIVAISWPRTAHSTLQKKLEVESGYRNWRKNDFGHYSDRH